MLIVSHGHLLPYHIHGHFVFMHLHFSLARCLSTPYVLVTHPLIFYFLHPFTTPWLHYLIASYSPFTTELGFRVIGYAILGGPLMPYFL